MPVSCRNGGTLVSEVPLLAGICIVPTGSWVNPTLLSFSDHDPKGIDDLEAFSSKDGSANDGLVQVFNL